MKKLKLFFACLLMAVLSIGQVWAAEGDVVYTLNTASTTIATSNSYSNYADATNGWKITLGSKQTSSNPTGLWLGSNSGQKAKMILSNGSYSEASAIASALGIEASATYYAAIIGTNALENVGKVTLTYGATGGKAIEGGWILYSTNDGESWSVAKSLTSFNAEGTDFVFDATIASARYAFVMYCSAWGSLKVPVLTFYEGATGGNPKCATPTFSPTAGDVVSGTEVTISSTTEGATIYYTTDGTDPTTSSSTSQPVVIDATKTIKAIAVAGGYDNSSVASATYTVVTPLTTMQGIFDAATTTDATKKITFNSAWVVTGVTSNGKTAYLSDGTKGLILYNNGSSMGLAVGNTLSGTVDRTLVLYNGAAELKNFTTTGLTVGTGGVVTVNELDAEGIAALTGANTGSVIKISGACTKTDNKYYIQGVQLYNQLYSFSVTEGTNYECTGVYVLNTSYGNEILPRSAADIVAQTSIAKPTFSVEGGTYTEVQSVELACTTDGATIYYTTDGTNPTNASTAYSSAISVNASMTIKAIAYVGEDKSEVASATYTINLPIPSHDFQVTHHFSTGEGFEFPTGWGGSYAEHEIAYTDDKVVFAAASKQSSNITDRPVVKEGAIELVLTNSHKLISAVRFDYLQWTTKVPTLTMKYSTDGGETYSNFDPVVSSTNFALQVLDMPEGVNAIQVVGTADRQVGLTSIAFDLVDKPIVTKTVTITAPTNGTLVVKNGEDAISSGDDVEVGTILTITATPDDGYILTEVTVNGSAYAESTLTLTENVTIAASFEENVAPDVESYVLSEIGVEIPQSVSGLKVGDKVNLPLTATECSKVFRGWSANASCAVAPEFAPGAEITLAANNKFYAVYADVAGSTWNVATSLEAGDVVVISTNTGYTANDMKTAGAISSSLFSCLASTYNADNSQITALAEGTLQFTVGGNATDGWTLMNGTKYLKVTAAKKVNLVDDEETWAISFSGNNATLVPATGDLTAYSIQYNYNTGNDRFTAYNTNQVPISLYKQVASYENYSTDCQAAVATPTFAPAAGTYTSVQNVTISCETTGATIHYTTNGDEPTASSTAYSGAIEVGESMTIKAIAVKAGMANSAVATATYTINLPLSTIPAIFAAATSTQTEVSIAMGSWVVSGVGTDLKTVYVTDGTNGFIIYNEEHGFEVGDILSGTITCELKKYRGAAELIGVTNSTTGLTVTKGGTITPAAVAPADLAGVNTGALISLSSWKYDGSNLTNGTTEIQPYTTLYNFGETFVEDNYYNVSGIYLQFDSKKEILPRSSADIEELTLDDPELSYDPASVSLEVGQALSAPTFNNPHTLSPITYAVTGDPVATVTNEGVIALVENATGTAVITASFAGNAQYAAGNATFTITVSEPVDAKNVVIIAEYDSKFYALTTNVSNKTAAAVVVEKDGDKIVVASAEDKAAIQWKKITDGENTTFQDADDNYLKGVYNGGDLTLVTTVCNWSWDGTNNCYAIGTRSFIYRENANGFKNYAVQNAGTSDYSSIAEVIEIDPENIVITSKKEPELAYTPASVEITVGDELTPAVLSYAEGFDGLAAVTYASNNESVATVDESGVVSLVADATGTTTITASFPGNTNYLSGSASYTITVNEAGDDLSGTWTRVTSVVAGQKIIIAGTYNEKTMAMGKQNSNNRAAVLSTLDGDVLTPGAATKVFTLVDAGEGLFAIQASNGKYLDAAGTGSSNYLREADDFEAASAKWTITFDENGANVVATSTGNRNVIRYNSTSNSELFSCYAAGGQRAINIYSTSAAPVWTEVRPGETLTTGKYYTICLDKAITAIQGATLWSLNHKNSEGTLAYLEEETPTSTEPLEAGKPFFMYTSSEHPQVVYTGDPVTVPVANGALRGTLTGLSESEINDIIADNEGGIYMLYNNALRPVVANQGNYLVAHRAYVLASALTVGNPNAAPGKRVIAMPMQKDEAQGFENIETGDAPMKVMIEGQMYILRGERVYDATGRLVK